MENKDLPSETVESEATASPEKSSEPTNEVIEEESEKPDATESNEDKPTQNGETEAETPEISEESDKNPKPIIDENLSESNDKPGTPGRTTRGTKRKATESEKNDISSENVESETVEQKENVDSKNDDNVQKEDDEEDSSMKSIPETQPHIMGKGKRARIPNKRYSDILLSPNRKSTGHSKSGSMTDYSDEITIKEEPMDSSSVSSVVSSPSLPVKKQRASAPKENLQDPRYLKPFKFGWKRELVWRSTSTSTKPAGDIYYYTPDGKKVRSFREVSDLLTGKNLTIDNFTFTKEPIGIDDPEKEVTRHAKIMKSDGAAESPFAKKLIRKQQPNKVEVTPAKKTVKPPAPKQPTPPSVTKEPVKMPQKKGKSTPVAKKPKLASKPEEPPAPAKVATPPPRSTRSSLGKSTSKPCQPCSIRCDGLQGVVPTLQCRLCLCLYHHDCVGIGPTLSYPYVCKNCQDQGQTVNQPSAAIAAPPPLTSIKSLKSASTAHSTTLPKLQRIPRPDSTDPVPILQPLQSLPPTAEVSSIIGQDSVASGVGEMPKLTPKPPQLHEQAPNETNKSLVGSVTSWLPHNVKLVNSEESTEVPRPQYVEYLNGRKFLVIPKRNLMSVSSSNCASRSEESIVTPNVLQPTEVPIDSASLGPSDAPNTPVEPKEPEPSPAEDPPEVKEEPCSPVKAEEKLQSVPMEVDVVPEAGEGDDSPSLVQEHQEEKGGDDEAPQNSVGPPIQKKRNLKLKSITNASSITPEEKNEAKFMENYLQNLSFGYNTLLYVFQYLKIQDLLRAGCVCTMWRDIASHPILWRTVRMKNSQVHSFEGLANTLKQRGTTHLDLRKMLLPSNGDEIWPEFSEAIARVNTLKKIELCRCPASVVEQLATSNPTLEIINAVTIKCESINLDPLKALNKIKELRLKSTSGLTINSIDSLKELKTLKILSLTSVSDLHKLNLSVIAELTNLQSLDLGECTDFPKTFGQDILAKLEKLEKLRLEKGQGSCHTFEILEAVKDMKKLEQLELVNFDVKAGFDKALGVCTNIRKLMIIPTYISQSATTNNMVLAGVLRLHRSLTHFVWGVTLELLRVTELFVDQCEDSNKKEKRPTGNGDSIPVLKPVPDLSHGGDILAASNPPQVEILPLPNLQKLLLNSLPTTRVKILKIPFHATWRQTLTDSV